MILLSVILPTTSAEAATPMCFGKRATIIGTPSSETLQGTPGPDVIVGRGGHDFIPGRGGNDRICGGGGADTLRGGRGDDKIKDSMSGNGEDPTQFLEGGPGNDLVKGEAHYAYAYGNAGNDIVHGFGPVYGGAGHDRLVLHGDGQQGFLIGGRGNDVFDGSLVGRPVAIVDYAKAAAAITLDLRKGIATGEGRDRFISINEVYGSRHDDVMLGDKNRNWIDARAGNDTVRGRGGDDVVTGHAGADDVGGGWGRDQVNGSAEPVMSIDGDRNDVLRGGKGPDLLLGSVGSDELYGARGDDRLYGGSGIDRLYGGPGTDECSGETVRGCEK